MELDAKRLSELLGVMRQHGCARLQADGLCLELFPVAPAAPVREVVSGTGTDADGLPKAHPGLRGVQVPRLLQDEPTPAGKGRP